MSLARARSRSIYICHNCSPLPAMALASQTWSQAAPALLRARPTSEGGAIGLCVIAHGAMRRSRGLTQRAVCFASAHSFAPHWCRTRKLCRFVGAQFLASHGPLAWWRTKLCRARAAQRPPLSHSARFCARPRMDAGERVARPVQLAAAAAAAVGACNARLACQSAFARRADASDAKTRPAAAAIGRRLAQAILRAGLWRRRLSCALSLSFVRSLAGWLASLAKASRQPGAFSPPTLALDWFRCTVVIVLLLLLLLPLPLPI